MFRLNLTSFFVIMAASFLTSASAYAGLFCGDSELPCDLSKIDTNRYETKIVKDYRFSMVDSKPMRIPIIRKGEAMNVCDRDPQVMTPVVNELFQKSLDVKIKYASEQEYPSQNLKLYGCRVEAYDFNNKKQLASDRDCLKMRVDGYLQINIICSTAEISTVKGILTPKEIEAERCAKVVTCGSNLKTEKQLRLYAEMKKQFCGSGELENINTLLNIDNSERAKMPGKSDSQSGGNAQVGNSIAK